MSSSYYRLLYALDGRRAFLIWSSNDSDGVVVEEGLVVSFSSEDALRAFAARHRLALVEEEPILHDLDAVQAWVSCPRSETVSCSVALAAWNLFGDIARSLPSAGAGFSEVDRAEDRVYDKLFFGNNLPAVTPVGERYDPAWSAEEVAALARVLERGLRLFRGVRSEVAA